MPMSPHYKGGVERARAANERALKAYRMKRTGSKYREIAQVIGEDGGAVSLQRARQLVEKGEDLHIRGWGRLSNASQA